MAERAGVGTTRIASAPGYAWAMGQRWHLAARLAAMIPLVTAGVLACPAVVRAGTCPLVAELPEPPPPSAAPPQVAPGRGLSPGTASGDFSDGNRLHLAGLALERQADDAWLVFDFHGRHVARIGPDGAIEPADAIRPEPTGGCGRNAALGIATPGCSMEVLPRGTSSGGSTAGALASAAIFAGWAAIRGIRTASRHSRVRLDDPAVAWSEILERTARFRTTLGLRHYRESYCGVLAAIERDVSRAWQKHSSIAARKTALFETWDRLDDRFPMAGPALPADAVVELRALRDDAVDRARTFVMSYVRIRLPRGSEHAYRPSELERLNAHRRSAERFEPYGRLPISSSPEGPVPAPPRPQ